MKKYVVFSADGLSVQSVDTGLAVPPEGMEIPMEFDMKQILRSYPLNGVLTPRPEAPPLTEIGGVFSVLDCPVGTKIIISDTAIGEVMADIVTTANDPSPAFTLPDEGFYQIEITPPFPYLHRIIAQKIPIPVVVKEIATLVLPEPEPEPVVRIAPVEIPDDNPEADP